MYCGLLQEEHLTTYPHTGARNKGFHNKSYIEEQQTNERGPEYEYTDEHLNSRPHSYTEGDLNMPSTPPPQPLTNRGLASGVAVHGTNLHSPATEPYLELLNTQDRYHQPSARVANYERQALNRMDVPSDPMWKSGANEQTRAPHISRTDSDRSTQPYTKNRPAASIAPPRVDLYSPAPGTDAEYLEPRRGLQRYFTSADNYKPTPLRILSVSNDVTGNSEPDGQRKAPHLHRRESDRPAYRPPASATNLPR